jgi:5-methyltetrahydrofolate--homocysteine methyltransferase
MKNVVDLCKEEGIRDQVKIMIGGAPITEAFKVEIGADAYTSDAASAAEAVAAFFA